MIEREEATMASQTSLNEPAAALHRSNTLTMPSTVRTTSTALRRGLTAPLARKVWPRTSIWPVFFFAASLPLLSWDLAGYAQTRVPSDVQPLCNVPKEVFEGWFGFSAVTPNGLIASPNNIIFDDDPKPPPATVA